MSWIVQSLLNNRVVIKEQNEIESDEYNDLLLIEKKIDSLKRDGLLSDEELETISEATGDTPGFYSKSRVKRETLQRKFTAICDRLAFYLGGYFTDEGYLDYMRKKYRLDEEQLEVLRTYMKSVYKHKIIRKPSPTGFKRKGTEKDNVRQD